MRKVRRINHCKMIALLPRFVKENNINVGDRLFVAYEGDRLMVVKLPQDVLRLI
jgi:hypothetical protein